MHLLLILGIAVLVFGPKRLPELGRGLGASIRGFKEALEEHHDAGDTDEKPR
jgi:sec-independent protein translocase protein TatA